MTEKIDKTKLDNQCECIKDEPIKSKDYTSMFLNISKGLSILLVPISVAFVPAYYTNMETKQKNTIENLKIGLGLLNQKPTKENQAIRIWAADVLAFYSPVPMSDEAKNALVTKVSVPDSLTKQSDKKSNVGFLHSFSWAGDTTDSYEFEVQTLKNGNWYTYFGRSQIGVTATISLPLNTKIRWSATKISDLNNGKIWQPLSLLQPLF
jgi:hypothetical protein